MPDPHDPAALVHHAVQAGDWRLAELIARTIAAQPSSTSHGALRTYRTLLVRLGLSDSPADYDHR
jgi:hypothetical protein